MATMDLGDSNDLLRCSGRGTTGSVSAPMDSATRKVSLDCCCWGRPVVAAGVGIGAEEDQPRRALITSPSDRACCMCGK